MSFFFQRDENDDAVTVVFKPQWVYAFYLLVAMWAAVEFIPALEPFKNLSQSVTLGLLILLGWRFFSLLGVRKEIRQAMSEKNIEITGSSLSLSKPVTYVMPKAQPAEDPSEASS